MSDRVGDAVGQGRTTPSLLGFLLTVFFGPFILARPPEFSGWPLSMFLTALFGTLLWGAGLYQLYLVIA